MKLIRMVVAGVIVAALSSGAMAQFVKGNEAVRVMPDGTKKVETPPIPAAGLSAPCPAEKQGCAASGWRGRSATASAVSSSNAPATMQSSGFPRSSAILLMCSILPRLTRRSHAALRITPAPSCAQLW